MNNLGGTQWRPLHPTQNEFGSAFQPLPPQQARRQITKNPHNMYQNNFSSNNGGPSPLGGFANGFGGGSGGSGGGPMSPTQSMTSSASTGRLGRLMSPNHGGSGFDFGCGLQPDPPRVSPSFNGMRNSLLSPQTSNSSGSSSNTNNGGMRTSNGYNERNNYPGFDRSISNMDPFSDQNQFNKMGNVSNNFGRQQSMPSSMDTMANGMRSNGFGGEYARFGRAESPLFGGSGNSGPFKDMQIGTWDGGSSGGGGSGGGTGNGGLDSSPNARNAGGGSSNSSYFEIGTFNVPTPQNGYNSSSNDQQQRGIYHNPHANAAATSGGGPGIRETGIIEKLLHSYGFIQCCDRQARLFFHFSQFDGTIEHLRIGDPVEFEMTYDRRAGKPIASNVSKIAPEVVMREERVIGTVTTEARVDPETGQETGGRISYENRGECFFLPFTLSDVEGNVTVISGDKCSFQMATMARSGNLVARTIRLENPVAPVKYQGVINSVKDNKVYGTIERSDVVREILFHFADVKDGETVNLGDDVEYTIQTRDGKEVACNITALPRGTVVFEDVGSEFFTGQVLKPLDRHLKQQSREGEALSGRIKYRDVDRSEVEVLFGEKDQVGDFTLRHGDWVKFVIAVDRRDKLKRATRIELLDRSFNVSDERREQGKVVTVNDECGYIKCATRERDLFFNTCECLDVKRAIQVGDECEFTAVEDVTHGLLAVRIKHLPPGSVEFDVVIRKDVVGKVEEEPTKAKSACSTPGKTTPVEGTGKIIYELNGCNDLEIPLYFSDCGEHRIRREDVIKFDIKQCKATRLTSAVRIRVMESPGALKEATAKKEMDSVREFRKGTHQGYIAALKDGFGFVETLTREKEVFFHFSNIEGKADKLEVGMEVEYTIFNREKGGKVSAEGVKVLTKGSIAPLKAKEEVMNGKVVRPLRSVNPDQDEYCGLIQVKSEEGAVMAEYEFGIASLLNKKELLQVGDPVQFQVHLNEDFAVNIQATREKLRSNVEAMKGQFGFLSYEVEEGKKLFFHTSEVEGGELLQQGDEVEFVVVTNKRTGKHSACCVRKLSSSKRPERLISKLKTMNLEDAARGGKKIVVIRQPRGPDGGQGFKLSRNV